MTEEEPPGLLETVADKFAEYNKNWIELLFESYDRIEIVGASPDEFDSWLYKFHGAVPRIDGGKCGDYGGRTKAGAPCKKKARNGRCATHPVDVLTVTFGKDDGKLRPIPTPDAKLTVRELEHEVVAKRFVSATHIWSEIILSAKKDIGLKPEAWLVTDTGERAPVDELWPSSMLLGMYPGFHVEINGQIVQPGYRLGDYGVGRFKELSLNLL
jgi:hypothetical protein